MGTPLIGETLSHIYQQLINHYGPQHWWPAEEPFEVMVGAILTQAAAWVNVEKAIANLRQAKALAPEPLRRLEVAQIAQLIRPCGYYNVKAAKLKALASWLGEYYQDNLDRLFAQDTEPLRRQLLSVFGIGQETADSIILYAANKPVFVIDAYTRRILSRLGLSPAGSSYSAYQRLFMDNLPADARLFNEYHALLVRLGKTTCRPHPLCGECCLNNLCQFAKNSTR